MPSVAVKSICKCGKPKPSTDRYCSECKSKETTGEWAHHHRKVKKKYGVNPYHTPQWRRMRNLAIARDRGLCQECLRNGRTTAFSDVDHIESHFRGGKFFDLDNLQCLCKSCHDTKTKREIHE